MGVADTEAEGKVRLSGCARVALFLGGGCLAAAALIAALRAL